MAYIVSAEFLGERREALHVAEQDGHLALFPLDPVPLERNFSVIPEGRYFWILAIFSSKESFLGNGRGWLGQVVTAVAAKLIKGRFSN